LALKVVIAVVIVVAFGFILFAMIRGVRTSINLAKADSRSKAPLAWGLDEHGNPQSDETKKPD
jgi:hypothetical protein